MGCTSDNPAVKQPANRMLYYSNGIKLQFYYVLKLVYFEHNVEMKGKIFVLFKPGCQYEYFL